MRAVWEPQNKFQKWLDIEIAACKAHLDLGNIPEDAFNTIKEKAQFDVARIDEIESEINHDVIAFLTNLAEYIGEPSRFVHMGLTSTDVVDTALCLLVQDAGKILMDNINKFLSALKTQADTHKYTMMMGRTHGVHAEPLSFGLKVTIWYEEMKRNQKRLHRSLEHLRVGVISGAVGNYAHISPELEIMVCQELGLNPSPISTQILQRDRHAEFLSSVAIIGGTLEKIATEIRALQKTEFNEVLEPFSKTQKGSSAMPHKRNPITCERVSGLARVLRGYALSAMENQNLWHERDISHSSVERVIFPDATISLDYMFGLMTRVITDMVINEEEMRRNIDSSYHIFYSQPLLLSLVNKGLSREDAYRIVQKNALNAFDSKTLFGDVVRNDSDISNLISNDELNDIFSMDRYQANIDHIYNRVY